MSNTDTKKLNKEGILEFLRNLKNEYFDSQTIYVALTSYLWLSMFFVPLPLRFIMAKCTFIKKRLFRIGIPVIATVLYAIFSSEFLKLYWFAIPLSLCITEYKKSRQKSYYNSLALLLSSMVALFLTDVAQDQIQAGFLYTYGRVGFPACMYRVFSIVIVILFIRVLNAFIKKIKVSSLIGFNLVFLIGAINYWTMAITNKEFALSDLTLIKTVAGVISSVQIKPSDIPLFLIYIALVVLFNVFICKFKWNKEEKSENNINALFALLSLFLIVLIIQSGGLKIYTYKSVSKMGITANLIASARGSKEPSGYEEFLKEINFKTGNVENSEPNIDLEQPNIIVVMSEAFSDLQMVADFETNEDYMPYIRELLETCPSGILYSSVYGNNTCSSEYEFLTGIPTGLTDTGGTIYQSKMTEGEESVVSLLKEQRYHTVGLHCYDGVGYNRKHAWECFGFDKMYFHESWEDPEYVRDFISDASFYDKIIEVYENKEEQSLFCFGISMQNHATYLTDYKGDVYLTDMEYESVNEYLSLLKITDAATKEFIEYFENVEEDTVIIFFGDHQPMLEKDFYSEIVGTDYYEFTLKQGLNMYKVPYFVWTNYEHDAEVPEEMSINYLPNVMLDVAGAQKNEWFAFTDEVFEEYPVITDNFTLIDGEFVEQDDVDVLLEQLKKPDETNNLNILKKYQVWSYKQALEK